MSASLSLYPLEFLSVWNVGLITNVVSPLRFIIFWFPKKGIRQLPMQTSYQRLSVTLGFTLLLSLLIVNAVITRRQLGVQVGDQFWVTHTQQTLLELSRTESLMKDAETGQRGFLYTGDPKYLAPYDLAVGEVTGHIDRLAELTAGQSWAAGAHFGAARFGQGRIERAGADDLLLPGGEARGSEGAGAVGPRPPFDDADTKRD